jgi:hypothetical protein
LSEHGPWSHLLRVIVCVSSRLGRRFGPGDSCMPTISRRSEAAVLNLLETKLVFDIVTSAWHSHQTHINKPMASHCKLWIGSAKIWMHAVQHPEHISKEVHVWCR